MMQSQRGIRRMITTTHKRRLATALATVAVGLGLLLSTATSAQALIFEPLTCRIVDTNGNETTTVRVSDPFTRRLRGYWFEFDSDYFWSKATLTITLEDASQLPLQKIVQTLQWPGEDGFGVSAAPFAIPKWFDVPFAGITGKATVKVYDSSGFLDTKTCQFHLAP